MRGGPRFFHQGFPCPGVLWIPLPPSCFRLRGFHPLWQAFPKPFCWLLGWLVRSEPRSARTPVWPLPVSLAATPGIDVSFFSSGYLDVSVRRVPLHTLWIRAWMHGIFPCGFPHSDTCGSMGICPSPQLFAACRVFHRLPVPRHSPCALCCLTLQSSPWCWGSCFLSLRSFSFPERVPLRLFFFLDIFDSDVISICMEFSRYICCRLFCGRWRWRDSNS